MLWRKPRQPRLPARVVQVDDLVEQPAKACQLLRRQFHRGGAGQAGLRITRNSTFAFSQSRCTVRSVTSSVSAISLSL